MQDTGAPFLLRIGGCVLAAFALVACSETSRLGLAAGVGPTPTLPEPVKTLVPTVSIAPAKGWAPDQTPTAAAGLRVQAVAQGLDHPRWLYVLLNGDILVAETNAPPKPPASGLRPWVMNKFMTRAGARSRVPIASHCCATRTVTVWPTGAAYS